MQFVTGQYYTRIQIQAEPGGEIQSYLPQKNGRIVAGCFGRVLNPDAPREVQAGNLPKVRAKAERLWAQADKRIPIFLKGTPKRPYTSTWQYQGDYELYELVSDAAAIEAAEDRSNRRGVLSYLLRFRPVTL